MIVFALPDLGEGLREAEIVAWHVGPGDHVAADQPLVSVETDKAVIEVPAPVSGSVLRLMAEEGEIVPVGAPLAEIETGTAPDAGAIVGDAAPPPAATPAPQGRAVAAPAVRRLARERGIELAGIVGSGPGGAILTRDLDALAPSPGAPLRGVRRAMAQAMARAGEAVVPATVTDLAIVHHWAADERPTLRLVRAVVTACAAEPALNAWYDGTERVLHDRVDLSIAIDTPEGLFSPVLRDAGRAADLGARLDLLRQRVGNRTIAPEEMRGGTITLSNFGTLGGRFATLVVVPPQVAILGAGRIFEACVAEDGRPTLRRALPLSLTFDHRVVTGSEAARFLAAARGALERPTPEEEQP